MESITLSTFNIRCFGYNGQYFAENKSECRLPFLKSFLELNFSDTDVFVFQEIMDLSILEKILPTGFRIYHYDHDYPKHMHIVLACKSEYKFTDLKTIPDTKLDETKSRPAFYGQLEKGSKIVAGIIGVHLKSGFEHTDKRILQCEAISKFIKNLSSSVPIVMAGDFNSHFKSKTKNEHDDLFYLQSCLKAYFSPNFHDKPTYLLLSEKTQLDHIWVRGVEIQKLQVYSYKNYKKNKALKKYYEEISDHLPVKAKLVFGKPVEPF